MIALSNLNILLGICDWICEKGLKTPIHILDFKDK